MRLRSLKEFTAQNRNVLSAILCVIAGSLCAKSFVINPYLYAGKSSVPAAVTDYIWMFPALALAWLFYRVYVQMRLRPRWGEALLGALFGVLNYYGTTLFAYDSWAFIGVLISRLNIAFKCAGQAFAMMTLLTAVARRLQEHGLQEPAQPRPVMILPRLRAFYREHTVAATMLLLVLCWSPYLVAFYPGTVISDAAWMFEQYIGLEKMTTWHSVFTTWFLGWCVSLGRLLGSDNIGCFLYTLLQTLLLAYAFGRVMRFMRRLRVGRIWQLGVMAFLALLPIWGCYAQMVGKDTFYTATLLVMFMELIELTLAKATDRQSAACWIRLGLCALLCCLWRNNGFYVVLPTAVVAVCVLLRGKARLRGGAALGAALLLFLLFDKALVPSLDIANASTSGVYSVCFQQTARVVRDRGRELTAEEKSEIDKVLDVETIGDLYEPWISDPVKYTYRYFGAGVEAESKALSEYRKTWFSMMFKYPREYIQGFMANNSGYYAFTPKYIGITYSQQAGARFYYTTYPLEGEGQLHTAQIAALKPVRDLIAAVSERLWTMPILSLLYCCAAYTWLLVAGAISLAHQKRWRDIALLTPVLLSFAVCLISPVNDYIRYYLPVIACGIPLMAYVGTKKEDNA